MNNKYQEEFKFLDEYYNKNSIEFSKLEVIEFVSNIGPFTVLINYWSQALGKLIEKCENYKIRKNLVKNLFDENCGDLTHVETFVVFLNDIQNNNKIPNETESDKLEFEKIVDSWVHENLQDNNVIKYTDMLKNLIENNSFNDCCQILGAIEYVYHLISRDINKYFELKTGRLPQYHYSAHEILDVDHANGLFNCSNTKINNDNLLKGANWIINSFKSFLEN